MSNLNKTMSVEQFYNLAKNKVGEIYVARKGTVRIFIIDNNTYMLSCTTNSAVVTNPQPEYWANSIDWAGGFSDYFTHQMCPCDKLTHDAQPIVPIKPEYLAKLKLLVV